MQKIAINVIATNKYINFIDGLCDSIANCLFKESEITLIVYSNLHIPNEVISKHPKFNFVSKHIEHEKWPFTTLKRFEYFLMAKEDILACDYAFYVDADSLFINETKEDILPPSGMIGTIHPCLHQGVGTPERNPQSKAYIPQNANNRYFCGGFFGGKSEDFINVSEHIKKNIDDDYSRNIIAIWHDESHLNKYFFQDPPAKILEWPYAAAENLVKPTENSGILFLDKNSRGGVNFYRE